MSQYKVMVDDNFHYMEEDEGWELGTFATVEEATANCRTLVDQSLVESYRPGMTPAQLYDHYTSFGDEPSIMAPSGAPKVIFSARDYARSRVEEVCAAELPPGSAGDL